MKLVAFRSALVQIPQAVEELPNKTLVRYMQGDFPKAVQWLLRHPALLRALADDAERKSAEVSSTNSEEFQS